VVALINEAILSGGGIYGRQSAGLAVKLIGKQKAAHVCGYKIQRTTGGKIVNRNWIANVPPPFLPKSYNDQFHQTGNSLGYCIQHATLMGAKEIVLLGFTLKSGSAYEFGRINPVTKRPPEYDLDGHVAPVLNFCRFYEKRFPGRVKLAKGWEGPIYDAKVFQVIDLTPKRPSPVGGEEVRFPWTR